MKSSTEKLLGNMSFLYKNIVNLLEAFQKAETSLTDIPVILYDEEGNTREVIVNSFQQIQQELNRVNNNFNSMTNSSNISYILNGDGSLSQYTKTSFVNAEYLENFQYDTTQCIVDKNTIIHDLVFPSVKLPVKVDSTIRTDITCRIFEITSGWDVVPENVSLIQLNYLNSTGAITYTETQRTLKLIKEQVKYFGKFTIETLTAGSTSNTYVATLNSIQYAGLFTTGLSVELKVGDLLVSNTGASKYQINTIDKLRKIVTMTRIAGTEVITVGVDKLEFNEILSAEDSNVVGVPIKPSQKIVVFLSTENIQAIGYPSVGLKFDTTDYQVTYNGTSYSIDEFFATYVTNFTEYLNSLIFESTIPYSLGVVPDAPVVSAENFKIVQINKHATDAATVTEISKLNTKKQQVNNEINFKQNQISELQLTIDAGNFKTIEKKEATLSKITVLRQEINTLKTNLLVIASELDANAESSGVKANTPKYRLIGFWPMQQALYSPLTKAQNIIKYDVEYRYLSKNIDTVENTSFKMLDANGKEINVAFSAWNPLSTKTLTKIKDDNGNLIWEVPLLDSVDDININQCAIPINENESVEVRIRAVSEAGYPISSLKSEWSEIKRFDFPQDLKTTNISSTVAKNNVDLEIARFEDILSKNGVTNHVAGTIKEGEKTFLHHARDIASGQYTAEQKNIPLDSMIITLMQQIKALQTSKLENNVTVQVIDFNNEIYNVSNNSTINLFAGNYTESVPLLDSAAWGGIIRKKGYIKIKNSNSVPVELKTLAPGNLTTFDGTTVPNYYNVPVQNDSDSTNLQVLRQVLFFRNKDLSNQQGDSFKLTATALADSPTKPLVTDVDDNAPTKTIVYLNGTTLVASSLIGPYGTDFVAVSIDHPYWNLNNSGLVSLFTRLKKHTENEKALQYQTEITGDTGLVGFDDYDFYSIGSPTCGAFLYPIIAKDSISVKGDTTVSTLVIAPNSEILVPFIYEYRMIDRIGNINGTRAYPSTDLEYSKKIGIDILVNDVTFKFDINVSSRLKSKINKIDSLNVTSILSSFNSEPQQIPN